ncbi:reverse transcriptase [Plakobranchus ocellatus]|uniref:Reverse transcriptase n=1 Tax=Plakobranchus ocellatus TaxID=259542 RepID=A0AAV4ATQ9_9GAST|nr:reverse transcriptase [Plakobranchus ocellatus]
MLKRKAGSQCFNKYSEESEACRILVLINYSRRVSNQENLSLRKGKIDEDVCFKVAVKICEVPYKSRMEEANIHAREKYQHLSKTLEMAGHNSQMLPIEVGAKGFVGKSAYNPLSKLSINATEERELLKH